MIELLDVVEAAEILTSEITLAIIGQANSHKEWIQANEEIYQYFGLVIPTPVPPTENPATTTTSTTITPPGSSQGSSLVVASFAIVAACAVVKMSV